MKKSELEDVLRQISELAGTASKEYTSSEDDVSQEDNVSQGIGSEEFQVTDLKPRGEQDAFVITEKEEHVYGKSSVCVTEKRGRAAPDKRSPLEIVIDATDGFVPLWSSGSTLKWKFNESSMGYFSNPSAAKRALRILFGRAIHAWGDAAPVRFSERRLPGDPWDFEIVMMRNDDCDPNGCVLASAFFPDAGTSLTSTQKCSSRKLMSGLRPLRTRLAILWGCATSLQT